MFWRSLAIPKTSTKSVRFIAKCIFCLSSANNGVPNQQHKVNNDKKVGLSKYRTWSPAPRLSSSWSTQTPEAISGDCCSTAISSDMVL